MFDNPKIQTVGFDIDKMGDFEKDKIKAIIEKEFAEISKKTEIVLLKVHLKIHSDTGGRHKYSTHAHIKTHEGEFNCEDFEWNAFGSVSKALEVLKEQVKKHIAKKNDTKKEHMRFAKEGE